MNEKELQDLRDKTQDNYCHYHDMAAYYKEYMALLEDDCTIDSLDNFEDILELIRTLNDFPYSSGKKVGIEEIDTLYGYKIRTIKKYIDDRNKGRR